ncbi:hypothetical protein BH11GEM2_BH11GEM2_09920 [soil metagenome]
MRSNAFVGSVEISGATAQTFTVTLDKTAKTMTAVNAAGTLSQTVAVTASGAQDASFGALGLTVKLNSAYVAGTSEILAGGAVKSAVVTAGSGGAFLIGSSGGGSYTTGNTGDFITIANTDLTTNTLGLTTAGSDNVDVSTSSSTARSALTVIDAAIAKVSTALGDIGAAQNRITYGLDNAKTAITNFTAAESVIRDVDMAEEMTKFSKNNILAQAGTAMLAQANQSGQSVLKLLQ